MGKKIGEDKEAEVNTEVNSDELKNIIDSDDENFVQAPDIRVEQILSMTVAAHEALQGDFLAYKENDKKYDIVFLPRGPEIFVGILIAAGISLLKREKKQLILIYEQEEEPDTIHMHESVVGPYMGKIYNKKTNQEDDVDGIEGVNLFPQEIHNIMEYIRVLYDPEKILFIGHGKNVVNASYLDHIDVKKTNIIIVGDVSKGMVYDKGILYDKAIIESCVTVNKKSRKKSISSKKEINKEVNTEINKKIEEEMKEEIYKQTKKIEYPSMIQVFIQCTEKAGLERDVVGYLNTGDFAGQKKKTTGFVCLVG